MPVEKSIPRCTCCLFIAAVTCHLLVLLGNIATANMLHDMGQSANGWSNVGSRLSYAMDHELNPAMNNVSQMLIETIDKLTELENGIDTVLSLAGGTSDSVSQKFKHGQDVDAFKATASKSLEKVVNKSMNKVDQIVQKFIVVVGPALDQVGEWLSSFGEKIQDQLEEFGTTIDRAQKIFDQVASKISTTAGEGEADMLEQTFDIFDTDAAGVISIQNMHDVSELYGITALQGTKGETLMKQYSTNKKGVVQLSRDDYAKFVFDETLPGLMTNVMRSYTKKLSVIGGRLSLSTMRAELADAVVDYVALVSAKNLTKIELLITDLVGPSSIIPIEFLADIWYEFYEDSNDPVSIAIEDIGQLFANYSIKLGPERCIKAISLLTNCSFFESEGFEVEEQSKVVKQVVTWVSSAPGGTAALEKYGEVQNSAGNWADSYFNDVDKKATKYAATQSSSSGSKAAGTTASSNAKELQDALLGGKSAAANGEDPDAKRVSGSGQPAKPETLAFAKEFSESVADDATTKNKLASDYSGDSSNALDSICNSINGMIKKTQSFLTTMEKYAGPGGQDNLKKEAQNFVAGTARDILMISNSQIDRAIDTISCEAGDQLACSNTDKELDLPMQLSGAVSFLTVTVSDLKAALPTVIDNLKTAKTEVSSVSSVINSIMEMLGVKSPPIFDSVSSLYKMAWIGYFILFFLFSFTMLFYAFWSSGWFGGPQANVSSSSYEPPQTFGQRIRTCCNSCCACISGCCSGHLCFWSFLLLAQVIVLLLFVISLVVCLLIGVQAFLGAGCSQIYLIGDDEICSAALALVQQFLKTFSFTVSLGDVCGSQKLLTCNLIRSAIQEQAVKVIIGALLSSVASFQMLIDSATKHERARCNRLLDEEEKEKAQAASSSQ